jgi:cytochrome d ubiquinol oxidase subunit I
VTPGLTVHQTAASLVFFVAIYATIFSFGTLYIYRLLRAGPMPTTGDAPTNASRPLALPGGAPSATMQLHAET